MLLTSRRILPPERLLHAPDALDHVGERLLVERQRPEVVDVAAAMAAPAEVIGDDGRLDAIDERTQRGEIRLVERIGGPDGERDPVQRNRHVAPHLLESGHWPAAGSEVVLAHRLHPVDRRPLGEEAAEVAGAKPEAMSQVWSRDAHARTQAGGARPPARDSLHLLRCLHLAALGLALLRVLGHGEALTLAIVLALAIVGRARAAARARPTIARARTIARVRASPWPRTRRSARPRAARWRQRRRCNESRAGGPRRRPASAHEHPSTKPGTWPRASPPPLRPPPRRAASGRLDGGGERELPRSRRPASGRSREGAARRAGCAARGLALHRVHRSARQAVSLRAACARRSHPAGHRLRSPLLGPPWRPLRPRPLAAASQRGGARPRGRARRARAGGARAAESSSTSTTSTSAPATTGSPPPSTSRECPRTASRSSISPATATRAPISSTRTTRRWPRPSGISIGRRSLASDRCRR